MRSVWICSRNDAIGNLAALLSAKARHRLPGCIGSRRRKNSIQEDREP
jgi:hypothetical protein